MNVPDRVRGGSRSHGPGRPWVCVGHQDPSFFGIENEAGVGSLESMGVSPYPQVASYLAGGGGGCRSRWLLKV